MIRWIFITFIFFLLGIASFWILTDIDSKFCNSYPRYCGLPPDYCPIDECDPSLINMVLFLTTIFGSPIIFSIVGYLLSKKNNYKKIILGAILLVFIHFLIMAIIRLW